MLATVLFQVGGGTRDPERSHLAKTTVSTHRVPAQPHHTGCTFSNCHQQLAINIFLCFSLPGYDPVRVDEEISRIQIIFRFVSTMIHSIMRYCVQFKTRLILQRNMAAVTFHCMSTSAKNRIRTSPRARFAVTTHQLCFQVCFPCSGAPAAISPSLKVFSSQSIFYLSTK